MWKRFGFVSCISFYFSFFFSCLSYLKSSSILTIVFPFPLVSLCYAIPYCSQLPIFSYAAVPGPITSPIPISLCVSPEHPLLLPSNRSFLSPISISSQHWQYDPTLTFSCIAPTLDIIQQAEWATDKLFWATERKQRGDTLWCTQKKNLFEYKGVSFQLWNINCTNGQEHTLSLPDFQTKGRKRAFTSVSALSALTFTDTIWKRSTYEGSVLIYFNSCSHAADENIFLETQLKIFSELFEQHAAVHRILIPDSEHRQSSLGSAQRKHSIPRVHLVA